MQNIFTGLAYVCPKCESTDVTVDGFGHVLTHISKNKLKHKGVCEYQEAIRKRVPAILNYNKMIGIKK